LDIVADHWDVLVKGDYEAVMPLPWRQKYFIKYVYPPVWTQQLGVFSPVNIDSVLLNSFIKSIPFKFKKVTLQLNSGNAVLLDRETRINYILPLSNSYSEIRTKFRKDRKTRLNKVLKNTNLKLVENVSNEEMFNLFRDYYSNKVTVMNSDYKKLDRILNCPSSDVFILGVHDQNSELLSAGVFLKTKNRIVYIFSASSSIGKSMQCSTLIINTVIERYSNTQYLLDFEGSMIAGVASFYRSFGSYSERYHMLSYLNLI
jgi:hypothetical protein